LEDGSLETVHSEEQKRRKLRKINTALETCGNIKHTKLSIKESPKKKRQKKYLKK